METISNDKGSYGVEDLPVERFYILCPHCGRCPCCGRGGQIPNSWDWDSYQGAENDTPTFRVGVDYD